MSEENEKVLWPYLIVVLVAIVLPWPASLNELPYLAGVVVIGLGYGFPVLLWWAVRNHGWAIPQMVIFVIVLLLVSSFYAVRVTTSAFGFVDLHGTRFLPYVFYAILVVVGLLVIFVVEGVFIAVWKKLKE